MATRASFFVTLILGLQLAGLPIGKSLFNNFSFCLTLRSYTKSAPLLDILSPFLEPHKFKVGQFF